MFLYNILSGSEYVRPPPKKLPVLSMAYAYAGDLYEGQGIRIRSIS